MVFPCFHATSKLYDGNMSFLHGDHDQVVKNRQHFLAKHNLNFDQGVAMQVLHTDQIQLVDKSFAGRGMQDVESAIQVDGLITKEKNLILFLLTADCLPIVFFDSEREVLGLAHVSRANTALNLSKKMITQFVEKFGSNAAKLKLAIGPGIHRQSYMVDLIEQNVQQLAEVGVGRSQIDISPVDTFQSPEYFSHRRSVVTSEAEGRFATIAAMLSA